MIDLVLPACTIWGIPLLLNKGIKELPAKRKESDDAMRSRDVADSDGITLPAMIFFVQYRLSWNFVLWFLVLLPATFLVFTVYNENQNKVSAAS